MTSSPAIVLHSVIILAGRAFRSNIIPGARRQPLGKLVAEPLDAAEVHVRDFRALPLEVAGFPSAAWAGAASRRSNS